jgi:hypothetical protein
VVENGPDGKSSTVRVTIGAPADGGQPLPPGPLAYLTFAVDKSAKPETAIELAQVATAFTAGPDAKPVTPLSAPKLKITVARPPVPACFFYMH